MATDLQATEGSEETHSAVPEQPAENTSARRKWRGLGYRLKEVRHRLSPTRYLHPMFDDEPPSEHDDEENLKTTPPPSQSVDLRCVWAVEFYPPSRLEDLIDSLKTLGLENLHGATGRPGPVAWLNDMRARPTSGGWMNLGFFTREKGKLLSTFAKQGPVPDFAEYVELAMFHVAPSFVAITATFIIGAEYGRSFERELRTDRTTYRVALPRGYSIIRPEAQKRASIEQIRKELRQETRRWFAEHLPGLFCRNDEATGCPVCEFLVFDGVTPFASFPFSGLADLVGARGDFYAFESEKWPGLRFSPELIRSGSPHQHGALAAEASALPDLKNSGYTADRSGHAHYFNSAITELMVQWGALAALDHFERRTSQVRDVSAGWTGKNAAKSLLELQRLTRESLDLTTVCRDLTRAVRRWRSERPQFFPVVTRPEQAPEELSIIWGKWIAARAKRLIEEDAAIKALVVQNGNLLATRVNLRLQEWVRILAVVTLLVTGLTAIDPAKEAYRFAVRHACSAPQGIARQLLTLGSNRVACAPMKR